MINESREDFIAFEGSTLEEAYKKACLTFSCSIMDLKSDIIQAPSNGIFGLFKKNAIIKVYKIDNKINTKDKSESIQRSQIYIKDLKSEIEQIHNDVKIDSKQNKANNSFINEQNPIFDTFYEKDVESHNLIRFIRSDKVLDEVRLKIDELFSCLQYTINPVKVSYYDDDTLYIEISGEDSALLIGKEGYRYKAISYILFNWIHEKYNLMIRLEVAEFLASQEESINRYLIPIIDVIKMEGFCKTKNLDGILIHIALTRLRDTFPDKYIAVKSNIKGEKYILVNEYKK